jgi:hypothetical protein
VSNQLDRIFAFRVLHLWVSENLALAQKPDSLLQIRRALRKQDKGEVWWNLTKEKAVALENAYAAKGWTSLVEAASDFALHAASEKFTATLAEPLLAEHARLEEQERQLRSLQPDGWEDELTAIQQLRRGIDGWEVELDSVGYLSVNGGVLRSLR